MAPGLPCDPLKLWFQPAGGSEADGVRVRLRQRKGTEHKGGDALREQKIRWEAPAARRKDSSKGRKDSSRAASTNSPFGKWAVGQNMNKNENVIKSGLPFGVQRGGGDRSHTGNRIITTPGSLHHPSFPHRTLTGTSLPESDYPRDIGEETKTRYFTNIKNH